MAPFCWSHSKPRHLIKNLHLPLIVSSRRQRFLCHTDTARAERQQKAEEDRGLPRSRACALVGRPDGPFHFLFSFSISLFLESTLQSLALPSARSCSVLVFSAAAVTYNLMTTKRRIPSRHKCFWNRSNHAQHSSAMIAPKIRKNFVDWTDQAASPCIKSSPCWHGHPGHAPAGVHICHRSPLW
jgi:hypothetical protein